MAAATERRRRWRGRLWLLPFVPAIALTLASWVAALVFARRADELWTWLHPDHPWTASVIIALWVLAFLAFAIPRRGESRPFAAIVITTLTVLGFVGGMAAFIPWSGAADVLIAPLLRTIRLFVGETPEPLDPTDPPYPIALQVAGVTAIAATFVAAALAALTLWKRQFVRIRMRFDSFTDAVIDVDGQTLPLVQRLARESPSPRRIAVVVSAARSVGLLHELDALGVSVLISDPAAESTLRVVLLRPRHRSLRRRGAVRRTATQRVYVVTSNRDIAVGITTTIRAVLESSTSPDSEQIQVIVRMDDSEHARRLRLDHLASQASVVVDAVVPTEVTATEVLGTTVRDDPSIRTIILCGDTALTGSFIVEARLRHRESGMLTAATAAAGEPSGWAQSDARRRGHDPRDLIIAPFHVDRIIVIDPAAADIKQVNDALDHTDLPLLVPINADWRTTVLDVTQRELLSGGVAVIITPEPSESSWQAAVRCALLTQATVWYHAGEQTQGGSTTALGNLREFSISMLLDGALPETTWNRIGRLQHEIYRRRRFPTPPRLVPPERFPWWHRDETCRLPRWRRRDNVQQARGIMHSVAEQGYLWLPTRMGAKSGALEGLTDVARQEHERWRSAMAARGYGPPTAAGQDADLINPNVVSWDKLDANSREWAVANVTEVIRTVEAIGYVPVSDSREPDNVLDPGTLVVQEPSYDA